MITQDSTGKKRLLALTQSRSNGFSTIISSSNNWVTSSELIITGARNNVGTSIFSKLISSFKKKIKKKELEKAEKQKASPIEIFEAIFGAGKKLEVLKEKIKANDLILSESRVLGQTALTELLEKNQMILNKEAVLFAAGLIKYIEEENLIEFIEKCKRGLKLDFLKNFIRLIPHDVLIKKIRADNLKIFDEYVILHFDPENKGAKLTEKEVEEKKDPILFGLINGSTKLYFIAEWKDEFCNLTFNEIIDSIALKDFKLK